MNTTQPVTKDFGPTDEKITVTMTSVTDHEGIYITTVAGGGHNSTLSRNFPLAEIKSARIFYGHIKDAAKAGKAVHQIEAEISALIEAIEATSRTPDEVAAAINADGAAYLATETAEHNRVVAMVAEVKAESGEDYAMWRANVRKQAAASVKPTLAQTVPARTGRTIQPTKTGVHCKPLTVVELDLIRHHRDGVVTTRPGQSWTVLRAIWRRIGGEPTYKPGTRIIASLTLNQAGLEVAAQQNQEQAA